MTNQIATHKILGMKFNPLTYQKAIDIIKTWIESGGSYFISISSVNNLVCALKDPKLMEIENSADLVTTDGMPLVWILKINGYKDCGRVYGPTLMLHILGMSQIEKYPVYFYGCTDEILRKLKKRLLIKFPKLKIAGTFSPPFRELSDAENEQYVQNIKKTSPKIVFVGISTPKQERWMHKNRKKFENCVLIGVGAAFLFHAGEVKQAPPILQRLGLEWFFRLILEPRRLWKRYIFGNTYFIYRIIKANFFNT